jgi:hypothetical protein
MKLEVMNAVIGFQSFRVASRIAADGTQPAAATVQAVTPCGDIPLYGTFLRTLGICNPNTDLLTAFGATLLRPHGSGSQSAPTGLGTVTLTPAADGITADFSGSTLDVTRHSVALLLIDAATGKPVNLEYGPDLERTDSGGLVTRLHLPYDRSDVPDQVRAYVMVDTYPAYRETVTIPAN